MATYSSITISDIVVGGDFRIPGVVTTRMYIDAISSNRVVMSMRSLANDSIIRYHTLPISDIIFCLAYLSYKTYSMSGGNSLYDEDNGYYPGGGTDPNGSWVYP